MDALLFAGCLMEPCSRLESSSRCSDRRSQGIREQAVMPSSSDSEKRLAVAWDLNVSAVTGVPH